ncbi:DUF368 domain-containing protein [Vibrio rumoiensis]|uniref:DUF368 domain-containing protein n=1 Tax=Vibrio rumoiensis 1S-45 TaxID=1188252 RepID=A0A1E5E045_9VIBR|nr:DUF368 domain-containing protein [Vibrio rumoiensis]OEF23625.1 DUF368 domain-containing protein [Vibrio rumoiensis 1S-45]
MNYFFTYLKGIAMGAADVVPGVSGGTIAFITGVYDTLLGSIQRVNPSLIGLWKREGFKAVLNHINAGFLIALFGGILTSILTLAKLISWLLVTHPIPLWSFFFGLILISVVHIMKQVEQKKAVQLLFLSIGIAFAYSITVLQPLDMQPTTINLIFAGAIAICAMILPGISGSFILLLLGIYPTILAAVKELNISILGLFAIGAVCGLLTFSHLLSWLLKRHRDATLVFLTGLMIGTLPKIWPWKETLSWRTNSHGEQVPLLQHNLLPNQFEHIVGQPSNFAFAVVCMLAGIGIVWLLEKFAHKSE